MNLDVESQDNRWDDFLAWLRAVLRLDLELEQDVARYDKLKARLATLSWRAVEELLVTIGLLMSQHDGKRKKAGWAPRVKKCQELCNILLEAWQETGYVHIACAL